MLDGALTSQRDQRNIKDPSNAQNETPSNARKKTCHLSISKQAKVVFAKLHVK